MKILVLETRNLSYDSSHIFILEICNAIRKAGITVEHCRIDDIEAHGYILEKYIGKSFDAVMDMNSILPMATEDGKPFIDMIDAPFVNMIVDHPLHLYQTLNIHLNNYNVICLDKYHQSYIRKYYPHIKNVTSIPLAGTKAKHYTKYSNRKYNILFPATYTPLSYYREILDNINSTYTNIADTIIDMINNGSKAQIHELFMEASKTSKDSFAVKMFKARYIDRYIREWYRDNILKVLINNGFHIDVLGARWEMCDSKYKTGLNIHPQCTYRDMLNYMADSKITLNVQPLFRDAPHDRIYNAMINGSVPFTDSCESLESSCQPDREYLSFDFCKLDSDIAKLGNVLEYPNALETISDSAIKTANNTETWDNRALKIINFIKTLQ